MHWESYYVPSNQIHSDTIVFPENEAHHLSRVRRKKRGDTVWVVDGEGTAYEVSLLHITEHSARGKILRKRRRIGESVSSITLAQAVLKGSRFDWIVEKATEIGVERIIPFTSTFTQTDVGPQRVSRWRRIAVSGMKQSGRSVLPEIVSPMELAKVLSMGVHCSLRMIAHQDPESHPLRIKKTDRSNTTSRVLLVVGPEGGFSEEEIETAVSQSFVPVSLGPRRLRSETAGILLCSVIMFQLGELD